MSKDFDEIERRRGSIFKYEPNTTENPMEGQSGEQLTQYYGVTMTPLVINEIMVWAKLIDALKDGIPKPYDSAVVIRKIIKLEKATGEDLSELKLCCPPTSDIREAKEFKPLIFGILDRIREIGGINNYVARYE